MSGRHALCLLALSGCDHAREDRPPAALPSTAASALSVAQVGLLTSSSLAEDDALGRGVAHAGDVDGDGLSDMLLGARGDDELGYKAGAAYLWLGSSSGPSLEPMQRVLASDGNMRDYFGLYLSGAGDTDGDGYDDVIVGASGHDGQGSNSGAAYVFHGSPSGLVDELKLAPEELGSGASFASMVASAGDVDGDGYDDVLVGSPSMESYDDQIGTAWLFHGSASGLEVETPSLLGAAEDASYFWYGLGGAGAGDLDGDGVDDVAVAAPYADIAEVAAGAVFIYLGQPDGIPTTSDLVLVASEPGVGDQLGIELAGAGDVDDDGYADLVAGAPSADGSEVMEGKVYLWRGGPDGPEQGSEQVLTASDAAERDQFGTVLDAGQDLNADGFDDVVVANQGSTASVYLYAGSATGLDASSETTLSTPDTTESVLFGDTLALLGDVDGDSVADLLVGAPAYAEHAGAAYLFAGQCEPSTWYRDGDGDGYGDPSSSELTCPRPDGWVDNGEDCDDVDPESYPSAVEIPDDGIDQDCDGRDTWGGPSEPENPTAAERAHCGCASPARQVPMSGLLLSGLLLSLGRRRSR